MKIGFEKKNKMNIRFLNQPFQHLFLHDEEDEVVIQCAVLKFVLLPLNLNIFLETQSVN